MFRTWAVTVKINSVFKMMEYNRKHGGCIQYKQCTDGFYFKRRDQKTWEGKNT